MPRLTRTEVLTQRMNRLFFQLGGPFPDSEWTYYGKNAQYAELTGESESYGGVNPIYMKDPDVTDRYTIVGRQREVPDLATVNLTLFEKIGYVPRDIGKQGCEFNIYRPVGNCKSLADFTNGWDYCAIYAGCIAEERDGGDPFPQDGDEALSSNYSLKVAEMYKVGQLSFGEKAAANIDREVVDLVWGGGVNCGNCGPADNGATRLYAITVSSGAGSPGLPPECVYISRDKVTGATTVYEYPLTWLSATTENPTAVDIMGDYIVITSNAALSYAYAPLNAMDGTIGTFTEVATGFVASKGPNDIFVASPFQAYLVGDGGYIYSLTNITAGVSVLSAGDATTQNLARVHGDGLSTLVAVGAAAAVVYSTNGGASWQTSAAAPGAAALTAVCVKDRFHWWVGGSSRYYTRNGGTSWIQQAITSATNIYDIVFATLEVGYTLYITASVCKIQTTINGGLTWSDAGNGDITSRVRGWPGSFAVGNRVAVPNSTTDISTAFLAVGGRTGAALTDGKLFIGASAAL